MHRRDFIRVLGGGAIFAATGCAPTGADPRAAWVNPGAGETDPRLSAFPYLDRWGAFCEREPGSAPWASRLFAIFRGATLSLGPSSASNSNIRYTAPRIVSGITRQLFLADADRVFDEFMAQEHHELAAAAVAGVGG